MESPGEYLKRERELRGVQLIKIFELTKVNMRYLEALEADAYDLLPHPTFVKGFIKAYCKCLGLDETDAVLRYEIYSREKADRSDAPVRYSEKKKVSKTPRPILNFNRNYYALAGIVFLLIILGVFVVHRRKSAPRPEAMDSKAIELNTGVNTPADAAKTAAGTVANTAANPVAEQKNEVPPAPATPRADTAAATAADNGTQKEARATAQGDRKHVLYIVANDVVWIKVKIDDGEPFDVVLRQGERISWRAANNFALVVGNAGGVNITFDGEKLSTLGASGEVVHFKLPGPLPRKG